MRRFRVRWSGRVTMRSMVSSMRPLPDSNGSEAARALRAMVSADRSAALASSGWWAACSPNVIALVSLPDSLTRILKRARKHQNEDRLRLGVNYLAVGVHRHEIHAVLGLNQLPGKESNLRR